MDDGAVTLEDRVDALETIAVRSAVLVSSSLLVIGSAVPVYRGLEGDAVPTLRLASAPFALFGALDEMDDSGSESFTVGMGVGFLLVLACAVAALVIGYHQWSRKCGAGTARFARITAGLLLFGMLFPLVGLIGAVNAEHHATVGPAMLLVTPGAILFAVTAYSPDLRRLWGPEH